MRGGRVGGRWYSLRLLSLWVKLGRSPIEPMTGLLPVRRTLPPRCAVLPLPLRWCCERGGRGGGGWVDRGGGDEVRSIALSMLLPARSRLESCDRGIPLLTSGDESAWRRLRSEESERSGWSGRATVSRTVGRPPSHADEVVVPSLCCCRKKKEVGGVGVLRSELSSSMIRDRVPLSKELTSGGTCYRIGATASRSDNREEARIDCGRD